MKPYLTFVAISLVVGGCSNLPTANVPVSYAKLDTGYVNSGIYDLGWVFVWDRAQKNLQVLDPLRIPSGLKDVGSTVEHQQTTLSSDTAMEFSADLTKLVGATGNLKSQIARSTSSELTHVARETTPAEELLNYNNAANRQWRKRLARDFPGSNFRFLVVDKVLRGSSVLVGLNNSATTSAGANIIKYGGVDIKVTFSGKSNFVQSGTNVPLVFQARMFALTGSDNPEFTPVTGKEAKRFNFQQAIRHSQ